mmetsp:Transcript_16457/g.45400  ORF Transcript_16457/g.45400 Transcript_16457/m.45400 type:complete len:108 (+) Transcript_16457:481-804(+)
MPLVRFELLEEVQRRKRINNESVKQRTDSINDDIAVVRLVLVWNELEGNGRTLPIGCYCSLSERINGYPVDCTASLHCNNGETIDPMKVTDPQNVGCCMEAGKTRKR